MNVNPLHFHGGHTMNKLFLTLVLAAMLVLGFYGCDTNEGNDALSPINEAFAAEGGLSKGHSGDGFLFHRMGFLSEVLNLNDEQKAQIQQLFEQRRENFRQTYKDRKKDGEGLSREEKKALRRQHREEMLNEIMPILTPEQQALANEIKATFERGEVPAILVEKRVEKLNEKLNLTPDQQAQLKTLFTETGQKMLALKNSDAGHQSARQEMKTLRRETDAKIQSILTPEQQKIYEELKAQRKGHFKERFQKFWKN
jgi:Spy/CpxP family protein refolding chaperone